MGGDDKDPRFSPKAKSAIHLDYGATVPRTTTFGLVIRTLFLAFTAGLGFVLIVGSLNALGSPNSSVAGRITLAIGILFVVLSACASVGAARRR
jgi:hypothetical protein